MSSKKPIPTRKGVKILSFEELKKLQGYERLTEIAYDSLCKMYDQFPNILDEKDCNMRTYGDLEFKKKETPIHECGTVGCTAGNAPRVKGLEPVDSDYNEDEEFCFFLYQERIFKGIYNSYDISSIRSFMFSGRWDAYQNNFCQGLERILIVLSGNYNPNWIYTFSNDSYFQTENN